MIDGIYIVYEVPEKDNYLMLDFWETLVNVKTLKRVTDRYTATFRGLNLALIEKMNKTGYRMEIKGSLHKYYNCGLHNADRFTFSDLLNAISGLCNVFGLDADRCNIHGLEIGVNLPLQSSPVDMLKNLVSYGNKGFDLINKKVISVGVQSLLKQYSLKIYDKAKQSKKEGHIIRFEVSIKKMQPLEKYQIRNLADLMQPDKVQPLVNMLLEACSRIIWTDSKADLKKMTDRDQKKWLSYSNPITWQNMVKRDRWYHVKQWETLLKKYGAIPDLLTMILNEWETLLQAEKFRLFYHVGENCKHVKNWTFLPLECKVKKSNEDLLKVVPDKIKESDNINGAKATQTDWQKEDKFCLSCGNDISHQRKQSKFCSAKYFGEQKAKQCRNKNSNQRLHFKRQIKRAMTMNNFLQITYHSKNGATYTETLHPSEILLNRIWLDRIDRVVILPANRNEQPEILDTDRAKELMKQFLEK